MNTAGGEGADYVVADTRLHEFCDAGLAVALGRHNNRNCRLRNSPEGQSNRCTVIRV
jgi:hypothetical protein